jgi:hypothetical protein
LTALLALPELVSLVLLLHVVCHKVFLLKKHKLTALFEN